MSLVSLGDILSHGLIKTSFPVLDVAIGPYELIHLIFIGKEEDKDTDTDTENREQRQTKTIETQKDTENRDI